MDSVEQTVCAFCQRPVILSYVPLREDGSSYWTCPYDDCRALHEASRPGFVVYAVASRLPSDSSDPGTAADA